MVLLVKIFYIIVVHRFFPDFSAQFCFPHIILDSSTVSFYFYKIFGNMSLKIRD